MKITVNHFRESLDYVPEGATIKFEKEKDNKHDDFAIKAFYKGKDIGYVSATSNTMAPLSLSNKEISPLVEDVFFGTVYTHISLPGKNRTFLIVEIFKG